MKVFDGARQWYTKLDKNLKVVGCQKSSVDPCVYYYIEGGELSGFLFLHLWYLCRKQKQIILCMLDWILVLWWYHVGSGEVKEVSSSGKIEPLDNRGQRLLRKLVGQINCPTKKTRFMLWSDGNKYEIERPLCEWFVEGMWWKQCS